MAHGILQGAWQGQTVPGGGLFEGSPRRRSHCVAHGGGRRCQEEGCTKIAQGARLTAWCMAVPDGASRKAAPRQLRTAARLTARRMAVAARRWAAPSQLKVAARVTAQRMAVADAASRRAVPSQLKAEHTTRNGSGGLPRRTHHCVAHGDGKRGREEDCFELVAASTGGGAHRGPEPHPRAGGGEHVFMSNRPAPMHSRRARHGSSGCCRRTVRPRH